MKVKLVSALILVIITASLATPILGTISQHINNISQLATTACETGECTLSRTEFNVYDNDIRVAYPKHQLYQPVGDIYFIDFDTATSTAHIYRYDTEAHKLVPYTDKHVDHLGEGIYDSYFFNRHLVLITDNGHIYIDNVNYTPPAPTKWVIMTKSNIYIPYLENDTLYIRIYDSQLKQVSTINVSRTALQLIGTEHNGIIAYPLENGKAVIGFYRYNLTSLGFLSSIVYDAVVILNGSSYKIIRYITYNGTIYTPVGYSESGSSNVTVYIDYNNHGLYISNATSIAVINNSRILTVPITYWLPISLYSTKCSLILSYIEDPYYLLTLSAGYNKYMVTIKIQNNGEVFTRKTLAYSATGGTFSEYYIGWSYGAIIGVGSGTVSPYQWSLVTMSGIQNDLSRYIVQGGTKDNTALACSGTICVAVLYNKIFERKMVYEKTPTPYMRINGTMILSKYSGFDLGGNGSNLVLSGEFYIYGASITISKLYENRYASKIVSDPRVEHGDVEYMKSKALINTIGIGGDNQISLNAEKNTLTAVWVHHHTWDLGTAFSSDPLKNDIIHAVVFNVPIHEMPATTDVYGGAKIGIVTNTRFGESVNLVPGEEATITGVTTFGVATAAAEAGTVTALTAAAAMAAGAALVGYGVYELYYAMNNYNFEWHELYGYALGLYTRDGGRHVIVMDIFLPGIELQHSDRWIEMAKRVLRSYDDTATIVIRVTTLSSIYTWDDYTVALKNGAFNNLKTSNIVDEALRSIGANPDDYVIASIDVVHIVDTYAEPTLGVQVFKNGLFVSGETRYTVSSIEFYAETKDRVIDNASEIVDAIPYILVNGEKINGTVVDGKAVYKSLLKSTSNSVSISVPYANAFVIGDVELNVSMVKPMEPVANYTGYMANIYYSIKNLFMRVSSFEFINVPGRAKYVERIFHYGYDTFDNRVPGEYLREIVTSTELTPTCEIVDYVLDNSKGVKFIDPTNGGLFEYGKNITIIYWLENPAGDASVGLVFNGTSVTSTLPRHLTMVIRSDIEQEVHYNLTLGIYYYEDLNKYRVSENVTSGVAKVDGVYYRIFNIQDYIYEIIKLQKEYNGTRRYLLEAKVTISARYDADGSNDVASVQYYAPQWVILGRNYTLSIHVYDAVSNEPIVNATVSLYGNVSYVGLTCINGWFNVTVPGGLYTIRITDDGYLSYETSVLVNDNMTLNIPLARKGNTTPPVPPPVVPPYNDSNPPVYINDTPYFWLTVQTLTEDGYPIQGAQVNFTTLNGTYTQYTDGAGLAYMLVRNGTEVNVTVYKVNGSNVLNETRSVIVTHHTYIVFKANWSSIYFRPEVALAYAEIHIAKGYSSAPDGKPVSHLIRYSVWTNTPQTVTIRITVYDNETGKIYADYTETVNITEGLNDFFTWFNISEYNFTNVYAILNITDYENDTDPTNNMLTTNTVSLRPFIDNSIFMMKRILRSTVDGYILPGDMVALMVGVKPGLNMSMDIPVHVVITARIPMNGTIYKKYIVDEVLHTENTSIVWINKTIVIPWSSIVNITAYLNYSMDDNMMNDKYNTYIDVAPSTRLDRVDVDTPTINEGAHVKLGLSLMFNTEPGKIILVNVVAGDNSSIKTYTVKLERRINIDYEVPDNPYLVPGLIKQPVRQLYLDVYVNGPDVYNNDNKKTVDIGVMSTGMTASAIIILSLASILLLLLLMKHVMKTKKKHTIYIYESKYIE